MRINVYAEHVNAEQLPEVVTAVSNGIEYTGVRIHLAGNHNAITFWDRPNEDNTRAMLEEAIYALDQHFAKKKVESVSPDSTVDPENR